MAIQVTASSDNQKVIETLTKVGNHKLDSKYSRIVILILTTKQRSYSSKNYPNLQISFSAQDDIWDCRDLSQKVSEIVDLDRLNRILNVLENSVGSGNPGTFSGHCSRCGRCGLFFDEHPAAIRIPRFTRFPLSRVRSQAGHLRREHVRDFREFPRCGRDGRCELVSFWYRSTTRGERHFRSTPPFFLVAL